MFYTLIETIINQYNKYYYYKVECKYCNRKFLRDKRYEITQDNVCSTQCFINIV